MDRALLDITKFEVVKGIVEASPHAAMLHCNEGIVRMANQLMYDLIGVDADKKDLVGVNLYSRINPSYLERHRETDRGAIACAEAKSLEWFHDLPDGTPQRIYTIKYPVFGGNNQVVALLTFSMKIDGHRRLEKEMLNNISRSTSDDLWILDSTGAILDCTLYSDYEGEARMRGRIFNDLIDPGHIVKLEDEKKRARQKPGARMAIRKIRIQEVRSELNLTYIPDTFYGSRYYVASRPLKSRQNEVLQRMMYVWGVKDQYSLAKALGVSSGAISQWKKNGYIPDNWIMQTYRDRRANVHYLITGKGSEFVD